ncbi:MULTISPECIES: hypothetical protein [Paracoccus]|uniref:Argininosuccinate lyase n=1 Tax=Paracoccus kondratievae TaxID=135740 RepID=A0AAD3NW53_9RHOB|nr:MULTISPECIES: hypothetical protein [Paracoccus]GLK63070.1 hypothetical protein GCM10017635_05390 [Paracoccus kondratievae]SMG08725.1 hypothetical protein SAMN02746000_00359 [Paracoccus sp. J56]
MTQPLLFALFALILATLAACGVDGPPTRPESTPEPGLHISGEAQIGVVSKL